MNSRVYETFDFLSVKNSFMAPVSRSFIRSSLLARDNGIFGIFLLYTFAIQKSYMMCIGVVIYECKYCDPRRVLQRVN